MKKYCKHLKCQITSGFTLIELLIVISILGILAAATLAILDPIDKIRAGNDSKVQQDVTTVAKAAEAYAAINNGDYPTGTSFTDIVNILIASGDLRGTPIAPGGYSEYAWSGDSSYFTVSGQLRSKRYKDTTVFKYTSGSGKSCASVDVGENCP